MEDGFLLLHLVSTKTIIMKQTKSFTGRIILNVLIGLIMLLLMQCKDGLNGYGYSDREYISVYADVMNYSRLIRLGEHELWGVSSSNQGCDDGNNSTIETRKLLWDGDSFSVEFTENCFGNKIISVTISGSLSSDRRTLLSFSGSSVIHISNDSIEDNIVYTEELGLQNVPLKRNFEGGLEAHFTETDLTEYVTHIYYSVLNRHDHLKPETFDELTNLDLTDPAVELNINMVGF